MRPAITRCAFTPGCSGIDILPPLSARHDLQQWGRQTCHEAASRLFTVIWR